MKKLTGLLICSILLLMSIVGIVGCGEGNDPGDPGKDPGTEPGPSPDPGDTFSLLSTLEFYNWKDPKDLVVRYEGGEISGVSLSDDALSSDDYTAKDGVLTIAAEVLDFYSEGKYELKAASGTQSDSLALFIGEQIDSGSRYIRRQEGKGENVTFYFDAQGASVSSVKCGETVLSSSQYSYDAENYLLTVKGAFVDTLAAGLYKVTVEAEKVSDSFTLMAYGGAGYAASAVFGASYTGMDEADVSLPLELFAAADTEYTVGKDGLSLTGSPEVLVSEIELENVVYRLDVKFKADTKYFAVFNGTAEVVTLNDKEILTKADDRTTAELKDGWWTVRAYFTSKENGISFRKVTDDTSPVVIESILLLKTKIFDVSEDIDLGSANYRVGSTNDVTFELPFDSSLIEKLTFGEKELSAENYFIEDNAITVSGEFLLGENINIDEKRDLVITVRSVTDAEGTIGSEIGTATFIIVGETIEAPTGKSLVPWVEGEDVTVQVDLKGGTIDNIKVDGSEISSDKYSVKGCEITIDASCFDKLEGPVAEIEISNYGGTFTVFANKGELILTADAESGEFDSEYNFFVAGNNGTIVSGEDALNGQYSYRRSGPKDTWNNIFETKPAHTEFIAGDYYLITFTILPDRTRADSDGSYNEIRTYFDLASSLSEITHLGQIKRDSNAREDGSAGVWVNEDGSLNIAVTLPAVGSALHIAFCFEGSAIFDDIMVYHLAEEETPVPEPETLVPVQNWNGEGDFTVECEFSAAATVKVNGQTLAAENFSAEYGRVTIKAAYLNANRANSYAVEIEEGNLKAAFMVVRGESVYFDEQEVFIPHQPNDWNDSWSSIDSVEPDIVFTANDYYTISYVIKTDRDRPDTDEAYTEIRTYFEGAGYFNEVTYKGVVKNDSYKDTAGATRVIVLDDGSLLISVTLQATAPAEMKFAFCFAGSAVYSNVLVTHIGSTLNGSATE